MNLIVPGWITGALHGASSSLMIKSFALTLFMSHQEQNICVFIRTVRIGTIYIGCLLPSCTGEACNWLPL